MLTRERKLNQYNPALGVFKHHAHDRARQTWL